MRKCGILWDIIGNNGDVSLLYICFVKVDCGCHIYPVDPHNSNPNVLAKLNSRGFGQEIERFRRKSWAIRNGELKRNCEYIWGTMGNYRIFLYFESGLCCKSMSLWNGK